MKAKVTYRQSQIIGTKSDEKGTNSRLSLAAQTATLCQPNDAYMLLLNHLLHVITSSTQQFKMERILCDLMLSGGLRISEALNPSNLKVSFLGQVFVNGSKGSESKLVTPLYFKSFWSNRAGTLANPFMHISRFSFHKWLVSNDIFIAHGKSQKNSTTHAMRHLHVYLMEIMEMDQDQIRKVLGHKGTTAIKYYLNGKHE